MQAFSENHENKMSKRKTQSFFEVVKILRDKIVTPTLPVTNPNSLQHSLQRRSNRPSLVLPITLELTVPLNVGELSPSFSFSRRTTPDAVAGWSFEAHSVPHSANVSDSQQWKHSRRVRLLPPSRSFVPPSPALRFQRRHPSLHLNLHIHKQVSQATRVYISEGLM
ncbi:hypothetical protein HN873_035965 [Arachis hypogaea]